MATVHTQLLSVLLSSALCHCASSEVTTLFVEEGENEPVAEEEAASPSPAEEDPTAETPIAAVESRSVLVVAPVEELRGVVKTAIDMYEQKTGLLIEIADGGIPIFVANEVVYKNQPQDALAHYDRKCAWNECNSDDNGVYIVVAEALLAEKRWALQFTIEHELAHIISGWPKPMHIEEPGHLLSPGCRNRVCWGISTKDREILCAKAPCKDINQ